MKNGAGSLELAAGEFSCWLADLFAAAGVMVRKTPSIRGLEIKVALPTPSQPDNPLWLVFMTD